MNLSTILYRAATTLATAAFAAGLSVAAPQQAQAGLAPVVDTFVTYQFTGVCSDCFLNQQLTFLPAGITLPAEGIGNATLVLKNFTGGEFFAENFVSFNYQSVIFSFDSTAPNETVTNAIGAITGLSGGPGDIVLDFINTDTEITTHFEALSFTIAVPGPEVPFLSLLQTWCIGQSTSNCGNNFDFGGTYTLEAVATPEPATLALLGAGLLGLGAIRRRARG